MAWFPNKVEVTFIDDLTGDEFAVSSMPARDLPETFSVDTTKSISGVDWFVVHAEPEHRSEFTRTRSLILRLRRIEKMDPAEILFSLPTIVDALPVVGNQPNVGGECVLLEDDWRQIELVSAELASEVDQELAAIRLIHENESASVGWRKLHVRRAPVVPITCHLPLANVARICGISTPPTGVSFHNTATRIDAGFAVVAPDGLELYGIAVDGLVTVLAIVHQWINKVPLQSMNALEALADEYALHLVDWCRCARAAAGDPLFARLLADRHLPAPVDESQS